MPLDIPNTSSGDDAKGYNSELAKFGVKFMVLASNLESLR